MISIKMGKTRKEKATKFESFHHSKKDLALKPTVEENATGENITEETATVPVAQGTTVDDATIELWKSVFDLEKSRFSFFDELFANGFVVDSLEVMSKGSTEGEHFVEAEDVDFVKKVDYGRVVFKTKHVYTGNFEDWYFNGPGRYSWLDGTVYQGNFVKGVMHGSGCIHWPDGSIYEGEFANGDRAPGWNVYSTSEGFTYAGDWQNGLPNGTGKIWYDPSTDDMDYYDGGWAVGLQHGFGIRQYSNGDRYIGNWESGERSGQGTMIWLEERQVYKGHWQKGIPNGKGKHIWYLERTNCHIFPSRHVYFGDWVDGKRHGIGKMVYPCGSTFEGRWKDGQRHGKGVFLNPAGALITGLFKSGDLVGGSEVPLHAPTYDCDFGGLVEYLTSKFHLNVEQVVLEEESLREIVIRFLEPLRQLYHRAGELSHTWGNNGLFPHWLQESPSSFHNIPNHHGKNLPLHMQAKSVKPPSPDGIYPVSRIGLWLLLKDCPQLTKDVTIGYFDKLFSDTPSISFQTRHNPFEPVLLWQFLQCLVIVAVSIYLEIPDHKRKLRYSQTKPKSQSQQKASMQTSGPENRGEDNQTILTHTTTAGVNGSINDHDPPSLIHHHGHHGHGHKKTSRQSLSRRKSVAATHHSHQHRHPQHHNRRHSESIRSLDSNLTVTAEDDTEDELDIETETEVSTSPTEDHDDTPVHSSDPSGPFPTAETQNDKPDPDVVRVGVVDSTTELAVVSNRGTLQQLNKGKEIEDNSAIPGKKKKSIDSKPGKKGKKGGKRNAGDDPGNEGVKSENEDSSDSGDDTLGLFHPETQKHKPYKLSIGEAFEAFLIDKLFPCLNVVAGKNLPTVPNPLPSLRDLYEAFQKTNGGNECISAADFMRTLLPHLSQPPQDDIIFWHRCPEMLFAKVNIDEILEIRKQSLLNDQPEDTEQLSSQLLQNEGDDVDLLGGPRSVRLSNKSNEDMESGIRMSSAGNVMEFMADPLPFSEQDLSPEPFLWKDESKCVPLQESNNGNPDFTTRDILNILRTLYPKLVGKLDDTNVHFDMVFCDWLWGISLAAKLSADREMQIKLAPPPPTPPPPPSPPPRSSVAPRPSRKVDQDGRESQTSVNVTPPPPPLSTPPSQPIIAVGKGKSRKADRDKEKNKDKENERSVTA